MSIPFGHTQWEADGFGEKNWIYRGQSKCITFYYQDLIIHNIWITIVQQCVLFKGDKRRDIDLEFSLNIPSITVWQAHSHPYLSWLKCDGFHPPFLDCVDHFYIYKKKTWILCLSLLCINVMVQPVTHMIKIANQFYPLLFCKILVS